MLCPSLGWGWYCRQAHAGSRMRWRWPGPPAGWSWANYYTTTTAVLSVISVQQIYDTMVLSSVTHSLVPGCKMRKEDPTDDICSIVTRLPPNTYTFTSTPCWWPGCSRHRSRSYFEFYKYFHTTANKLRMHRDQQPVIQYWSMCQCWKALAWLCCCVFEFENM